MASKGVAQEFTAAYHPEANPAETTMKIVKKTIAIAIQNRQNVAVALKEAIEAYNFTQLAVTGRVPAVWLKNRTWKREKIKTKPKEASALNNQT